MELSVAPVIIDLKKNQNSLYWNFLEMMQLSFLDHSDFTSNALQDLYSNTDMVERVSVCTRGSQILGGVIKEYNEIGKAFVINYLGVNPNFRMKGIGRMLVTHVENHARDCRDKGAEVEGIALRTRPKERPFYEKLDYRFVAGNPQKGYATMFKTL